MLESNNCSCSCCNCCITNFLRLQQQILSKVSTLTCDNSDVIAAIEARDVRFDTIDANNSTTQTQLTEILNQLNTLQTCCNGVNEKLNYILKQLPDCKCKYKKEPHKD